MAIKYGIAETEPNRIVGIQFSLFDIFQYADYHGITDVDNRYWLLNIGYRFRFCGISSRPMNSIRCIAFSYA